MVGSGCLFCVLPLLYLLLSSRYARSFSHRETDHSGKDSMFQRLNNGYANISNDSLLDNSNAMMVIMKK